MTTPPRKPIADYEVIQAMCRLMNAKYTAVCTRCYGECSLAEVDGRGRCEKCQQEE